MAKSKENYRSYNKRIIGKSRMGRESPSLFKIEFYSILSYVVLMGGVNYYPIGWLMLLITGIATPAKSLIIVLCVKQVRRLEARGLIAPFFN